MLKSVETDSTDLYYDRLGQIRALEAAGINPYPAEPPKITHKNAQLIEGYDKLEGSTVSIVGRMRTSRIHGGITFAPMEDETALLQAVLTKSRLGAESYLLARNNYGSGDFIGVTGELRKTKTGEISVWAEEAIMLAKALRVAPHTINNTEVQQRQRYLHTLVDPVARDRFRTRSRIVTEMRRCFTDQVGALEVETPVLDVTYGGALARPFKTHHNALDQKLYLRIANELYLKRYTIGGYYEGVFEFSRDFRNEGIDRTHNPEFTQVELYKPGWDYNMMMNMTEDLVCSMVQKIHGSTIAPFGDLQIDYATPWRRLTIYDGIRQKTGLDPKDATLEQLQRTGREVGLEIEGTTKGAVCVELFEQLWEGDLIQPTFVLDYPAETSALTKRHRLDSELAERFEVYVGGMEVGNCYSELNDPRDQRARFEAEKKRGEEGDKEAMPFDEDFILAMEYGMPLQAGIGLSIDRLTMLLTDAPHIRQVIYSPTLRRISS